MKLKVVVHEAEEGGYWGEVPSIPGCASQGETLEELYFCLILLFRSERLPHQCASLGLLLLVRWIGGIIDPS